MHSYIHGRNVCQVLLYEITISVIEHYKMSEEEFQINHAKHVPSTEYFKHSFSNTAKLNTLQTFIINIELLIKTGLLLNLHNVSHIISCRHH